MAGRSRLFCLDSVLIDVVLRVAALPPRSGDVRASDQLITTGGGFNAMSAAARHGMPAIYAGRLGTGPFAALARATLEREGVAAPVEPHDSLDTGICVVLLEPDGERTFVTAAGAESTLRASDLVALGVGPGDWLLVSGYNVMYPGLADVVLDWMESLAREVTVVFDPATRADDIPLAYFERARERADWLVCNASEARHLAGVDDTTLAASALASGSAGSNVLVRQGVEGVVVAPRGTVAVTVGGFNTEVVDTNGAGDVHNGVFIAELSRGQEVLEAARWANAAAAIAISRLGPATGPTRDEVATWLAERS